jgi:hypothetical protein
LGVTTARASTLVIRLASLVDSSLADSREANTPPSPSSSSTIRLAITNRISARRVLAVVPGLPAPHQRLPCLWASGTGPGPLIALPVAASAMGVAALPFVPAPFGPMALPGIRGQHPGRGDGRPNQMAVRPTTHSEPPHSAESR